MDFDIRIGPVELRPSYVKLGAFFEVSWQWAEHRYPWLWYDDRSGFQWGRLVVLWTLPREGRAAAAREEAARVAAHRMLDAMVALEIEAEEAATDEAAGAALRKLEALREEFCASPMAENPA